ncbi:MAG: hypothetical protein HKO92_10360 [Flavobacteriaceae bacterium]|nr:hypothetical protein [Bacteroidia bacterium]NNK83513.1 hypothetical protein [Flavobacteriaceae bacterium]
MKNFNLRSVVLKPIFNSTKGKQKQEVSLNYLIDDKLSNRDVIYQLTALMMTLPLITGLLLLWFNI